MRMAQQQQFPDIGLFSKVLAGTFGAVAREVPSASTFSIYEDQGILHIEVPTRFTPKPGMDETTTSRLVAILRGGLCHEAVGHGRHTDFKWGEKWLKSLTADVAFVKSLANICEDRRIEDASALCYPGARRILAEMAEALDAEGFFGKGVPVGPAKAITQAISRVLRTEGGQALNPEQTTLALDACQAMLGASLTEQILATARNGATCTNASTMTTAKAAEEIAALLRNAQQQQQESEPENAEGGSGDGQANPEQGDQGQSGDDQDDAESQGQTGDDEAEGDGKQPGDTAPEQGNGEEPAKGKPQQGNAEPEGQQDGSGDDSKGEPTEGQPNQGDEQSGSKSDDQPDDGASNSRPHHGGADAEGDPSDGPSQGGKHSTSSGKSPTQEPVDAEAIANALTDPTVQGDLAELIGNVLSQMMETKHQTITDMGVSKADPGEFRPDAAQASLATRLRSRLAEHLRSRVEDEENEESEHGALVGTRLVDAILGDPRVFEEEGAEGEGVNTAIEILVDESGSMSGGPAESALAALYACGAALGSYEMQGVKFALSSFNSRLRRLKEFHEPWVRTKGTLNSYIPAGGTHTPQAIRTVLPALCARREKRKILFLITDGDVGDAYLPPIFDVGRRNKTGKVEFRALLIGEGMNSTAFDKVGSALPGGDLQRAIFETLKDCF